MDKDALLVTTLAIFFVAISLSIGYVESNDKEVVTTKKSTISVYTDKQLGCQYYTSTNGNVFYPRLDPNGHHICHHDIEAK